LKIGVWGLGLRVEDLGCGFWGSWLRVEVFRFRAWGWDSGLRFEGSRLRFRFELRVEG